MQHHVLRQEVANRLMAADMASRDLQLSYLQGARKRGILGRSHTFSGRDHITREVGTSWQKYWYFQMAILVNILTYMPILCWMYNGTSREGAILGLTVR